jgi:hypothetical protein
MAGASFNWVMTDGRPVELSCRQVVRCERAYNFNWRNHEMFRIQENLSDAVDMSCVVSMFISHDTTQLNS